MVDAALDPDWTETPKAAPAFVPERRTIDGVAVVQARVIPAPANTPGRLEGCNWIEGLSPGDDVWHEKWGRLVFVRWDGGVCVTRHTREHLDPNAPPRWPRMGAIPADSKLWADPHELWLREA